MVEAGQVVSWGPRGSIWIGGSDLNRNLALAEEPGPREPASVLRRERLGAGRVLT